MTVDTHVIIDLLHDDILLCVFSCHRSLHRSYNYYYTDRRLPLSVTWKWHRLAQVCRRWRYLIFASPHHLGLRLVITYTPALKPRRLALNHWPALPMSIWFTWDLSPQHEDEVAAALEHVDRIYEIELKMSKSMLEKSAAWVEASFPALESLHLRSPHSDSIVLPDAFLAASTSAAPRRLLHIELNNIYFPTLPQFLLSSRDLVSLSLRSDSDMMKTFLSPQAIISALSATSQLKELSLYLRGWRESVQGSIQLPSPNHLLLPALNKFCFDGSGDYLEDLVSGIYAPLLEQLDALLCWPQIVDFPQLSHFIHRTEQLSSLPHMTSIRLKNRGFQIQHCFRHLPSRQTTVRLRFDIALDWQVSQLHHVCQQLSPLMSSVEQLAITALERFPYGERRPASWPGLFEPFYCVQELQLCTPEEQGTEISHALQQSTWQGAQEVFPALRSLWICDFKTRAWGSINSFIASRQLTGRQVTMHRSGSLPCIEEEIHSNLLLD